MDGQFEAWRNVEVMPSASLLSAIHDETQRDLGHLVDGKAPHCQGPIMLSWDGWEMDPQQIQRPVGLWDEKSPEI